MSTIGDLANATPTGLKLSEKLSYAEWESVGFNLAKVGKAMQWWIGDWVNYGGKRYGDTYKAAIDATGMSLGAVQNIASVCRSFETSRRREHLSFKHHVEVWSLEPGQQNELLDRAESESLSCAKLRELVRAINAEEGDLVDDSQESGEVDSGHSINVGQVDEQDWFQACVSAFRKAENRLEAMRLMIDTLEPFEAAIVRDWAIGRLS